LGRARIAFVGAHPDANREPAHLRLRGYREALAAAGLPFDESLVATTTQFGRSDGADGMRRLLDLPAPPDAIFAYNDLIAFGAMRTLGEHGLRIPEDIAVVGFDDVEEGRFSNPTLTTISPDKETIGRLAVDLLIARVEGRTTEPPREVQPPFQLVLRESTLSRQHLRP
jgi:DNA-binding LacI/PurR family transcriptional regulator